MSDDPLMHAIAIVEQHNNPERIRNAPPSATRFHTYTSLNPDFTRHPVQYNYGTIPDYLRITFTRFRLSSHYAEGRDREVEQDPSGGKSESLRSQGIQVFKMTIKLILNRRYPGDYISAKACVCKLQIEPLSFVCRRELIENVDFLGQIRIYI